MSQDDGCETGKGIRKVWNERDGDGRADLDDGEEEFFSCGEFCVYIGRCWQHRKNKDRKTLY